MVRRGRHGFVSVVLEVQSLRWSKAKVDMNYGEHVRDDQTIFSMLSGFRNEVLLWQESVNLRLNKLESETATSTLISSVLLDDTTPDVPLDQLDLLLETADKADSPPPRTRRDASPQARAAEHESFGSVSVNADAVTRPLLERADPPAPRTRNAGLKTDPPRARAAEHESFGSVSVNADAVPTAEHESFGSASVNADAVQAAESFGSTDAVTRPLLETADPPTPRTWDAGSETARAAESFGSVSVNVPTKSFGSTKDVPHQERIRSNMKGAGTAAKRAVSIFNKRYGKSTCWDFLAVEEKDMYIPTYVAHMYTLHKHIAHIIRVCKRMQLANLQRF